MSTVAIMNTSVETLEVLQAVLEDDGYTVVTAYIVDFKRNIHDLTTFFHTHQPDAVVYDIALPYVENWSFFRDHVLEQGHLPESHFILTTTNKRILEQLVGSTLAIELVGRPFDLDQVVTAVERALSCNNSARIQAQS